MTQDNRQEDKKEDRSFYESESGFHVIGKKEDITSTNNNDESKLGEIVDMNTCICGRKISPPHCVKCGGVRIYMYKKKKVLRISRTTNEIKEFKVYSCDRCGVFDEYQLNYECRAPQSKNINQRHKEELDGLIKKVLDCEQMTQYERDRFKRLTGGVTTTIYRRAAGTSKEHQITIAQAQEFNRLADEKIKEEKKQAIANLGGGIRRLGRSNKWAGSATKEQEIQALQDTNNPERSSLPNSQDIPIDTNIITNETAPVVTPVTITDNSGAIIDAETLVTEQENNVRKIGKDLVFEGGLTDDDLRNIPGIMRTD